MKISSEGYSPSVLRKIVTQGGRYVYAEAAENLRSLAEIELSAQHVGELTERVGREWAERRDQEAAADQQNQLGRMYAAAPQAAAVMLDGGRVQTRAADAPAGVHQAAWKEVKYACCLTLPLKADEADPQPEPPAAFLEPEVVARLVREMEGAHGAKTAAVERPA